MTYRTEKREGIEVEKDRLRSLLPWWLFWVPLFMHFAVAVARRLPGLPHATCHMPLSNSPLFAWLRIILTTFWGRAKGTHTNFIGQNFWSEPDSNEPDSCRWGVLDCQDTLQMGISSIWNTTLGFLGSSRLLVALKVAKIATVWVLLGFLRFWVFIEHALY